MSEKLFRFTDNLGSFTSSNADRVKTLYFPLCNEVLMSSISPDLHGDIKTGQNSFLLPPVSRLDLANSRVCRNFWIYIDKGKVWSAAGVSKDFKQIQSDTFNLEAGLPWHKINRQNKNMGLSAEILSFVPAGDEPIEVMQVAVKNISRREITFIPTAAIPIYGRSANNVRDHRHVTSLLQRIALHKYGVIVKPTLVFDETGHRPNKTTYFVLGWDQNFRPPQYLYPTQEMFCGEGGDLEAPESLLKNLFPDRRAQIQGREAMGALRFRQISLRPGQSHSYTILMGIVENRLKISEIIKRFNRLNKVRDSLKKTEGFWTKISQQISLFTGDACFDNWFRWVGIQPTLRRIFGCSFLPDFDYGKGGRGWRDLWQDCLCLILNEPVKARLLLVNNFSGVRIDGSNATIIGRGPGEFMADRNNISRVWMDHGMWPLLTLDLYISETGDFDILFEETTYFRDHQLKRASEIDFNWNNSYGRRLRTSSGRIYQGTILEHLLIQNLVQFFNVGAHNYIRLEGADWNDGLDMAREKGEAVCLSAMYAQNLMLLSQLLLKAGKAKTVIAKELKILLTKFNYNDIKKKKGILQDYFSKTKFSISGKKISIDTAGLANDLKAKSEWMTRHIRRRQWLREGFFNGYYDNRGQRVEGRKDNLLRMILISQVFPIMSSVARDWQVEEIIRSVKKHLFDKRLKGIHLNTDFKQEQHNLGRAFSFVYGDKENGAFFNHMIVLFAYALYKRRYAKEGWGALRSIYDMAVDTAQSKIYPCLPEYFNLQGRGMYAYLTGSASWFVLTLLTQAFGVRGEDGHLLIEPKLSLEQFKVTSFLVINRIFAGRNLRITFFNPKRLEFARYKIIKATLNSQNLSLKKAERIVISRKMILNLRANKINTLDIILG